MRSDSDIKRDVEEELRWEPNLDPTDIAIAVKNGVATLTGFVKSYAQKFAAERAAKRVEGVVAVVNDLEVRLPGADERPDPEIARDIVANLKTWLPNSWENVKVIVKNGWVTLEGEVEWNYQREYAERAVRWVRGVKGVSNLIRLQPRVAPDPTQIRQKIEEAFRRSAL
jgi:osmotically-inducible protein OsmY